MVRLPGGGERGSEGDREREGEKWGGGRRKRSGEGSSPGLLGASPEHDLKSKTLYNGIHY